MKKNGSFLQLKTFEFDLQNCLKAFVPQNMEGEFWHAPVRASNPKRSAAEDFAVNFRVLDRKKMTGNNVLL